MKLVEREDEVNEAGIQLEAAVVAAAIDVVEGRFSARRRRQLTVAVRAMRATDELLEIMREKTGANR